MSYSRPRSLEQDLKTPINPRDKQLHGCPNRGTTFADKLTIFTYGNDAWCGSLLAGNLSLTRLTGHLRQLRPHIAAHRATLG
jgi:hypothetical protein